MIDPSATTEEIEVPGAWNTLAIQLLTVMEDTPPDFPALGSLTLNYELSRSFSLTRV